MSGNTTKVWEYNAKECKGYINVSAIVCGDGVCLSLPARAPWCGFTSYDARCGASCSKVGCFSNAVQRSSSAASHTLHCPTEVCGQN